MTTSDLMLLTRQQVAARCQVSLDTVDKWTHTAGFPVIRSGNLVRIKPDLLDAWLSDRATEVRVAVMRPIGRQQRS